MKIILKIAKTELRLLFYSPIAWFIMIVFLVQCGIVYCSQLNNYVRAQELGGYGEQALNSLTDRMFLAIPSLFPKVMQNLYLYIPLLTMSLISRETGSGTIKLLYTSPIKVHEIVLGKYVAMMVYSLVLVAIIGIFAVSGMFHIQHAQVAMLLMAMLGFYLLLLAYCAIGLFMSTLTTYQVVAAIATFITIGILSYIGGLWQRIAFVRELTDFLSISGRTQNMLSGLLTTKDVIYFIVVVYIFLGFSIYKLKGAMEFKPAMVKIGRYVAIVVSALLIGYVTSRPGLVGYYDVTVGKKRTLTPQVQKILAELGDAPLEITAYNNLLSNYWYLGSPDSYNRTMKRWEPYLRFKHNIELKPVVGYYDRPMDDKELFRQKDYVNKTVKEVAEKYAKMYDVRLNDLLSPEQISKQIDLKPELNRYVMQLKWKDRTTFLRVFDDMRVWPGETEVAAALKRLLPARMPRIAFVTSELERGMERMTDLDYKAIANWPTFRYSMINQGFDSQVISLETDDIPTGVTALVMADPKMAFSEKAMVKLQQYIDKGGNLLITGEPGKQAILNPLLKQMGVQLTEGTVIQQSDDLAPNLVTASLTAFAAASTEALKQKAEDSIKVAMNGVAGLSYTNGSEYTIHPLLTTDAKDSWNKIKPFDADMMQRASLPAAESGRGGAILLADASKIGTNTDTDTAASKKKATGVITFNAADGDVKGPIVTAAALTRNINGKEQRIVITGDADFMSNAELQRYNIQTSNFEFDMGIFSWLSYGEFPVDATRPESKDKRLNVTSAQVGALRIAYVWVLPIILLASGTVLLIRRKRK
jgi:ABC-2 type transport system permease protein